MIKLIIVLIFILKILANESTTIEKKEDGELAKPVEAVNTTAFNKFSGESLNFSNEIGTTPKGRYMEQNCTTLNNFVDKDSPGGKGIDWTGLPVKKCNYKAHGLKAEVYMLNPEAKLLSHWITDACNSVGKPDISCYKKIYRLILNASGSQFPITGGVIEKMYSDRPAKNYTFKNGVTVNGRFGRPISITSGELKDYCSKTKKCDFDGNNYPDTVARLYKTSWITGENHIIRAKAFSMYKRG